MSKSKNPTHSGKPLHEKISREMKDLGYPKIPKGPELKFLYDFVKQDGLGIGHGSPDSLHMTRIEGYDSTEPQYLTDETCKKSGKRLSRKQVTDQRLNTEKNDLFKRMPPMSFTDFKSSMEDENEGCVSDGAIDTVYYEASLRQSEGSHLSRAKYGFGEGMHDNTPSIQKCFIQIISGQIHALGIDGARYVLNVAYESEIKAKPAQAAELKITLETALTNLSNWFNLETLYLEGMGFFELIKAEQDLLANLSPEERKKEVTRLHKKKRDRRAKSLKARFTGQLKAAGQGDIKRKAKVHKATK